VITPGARGPLNWPREHKARRKLRFASAVEEDDADHPHAKAEAQNGVSLLVAGGERDEQEKGATSTGHRQGGEVLR
jgi:hypothetical protein